MCCVSAGMSGREKQQLDREGTQVSTQQLPKLVEIVMRDKLSGN